MLGTHGNIFNNYWMKECMIEWPFQMILLLSANECNVSEDADF